MKKNNSNSNQSVAKVVVRLMGTLFLITAVVAFALGTVNHITKDRIARGKAEKIRQAMALVLPDSGNLKNIPYQDDTGMIRNLYADESDGYVAEVTPNGFGGEISMMVGIRGGKVSGLCLVSHTETPGLGAVAGAKSSKGENFRIQFVGQNGNLAVTKDGGTIDAITGATVTSRAVTAGVSAALSCVEKIG